MANRIHRRPTPSTVIALLALFVALGGTSYATVKLQIGSAQIVDNSILSRDIHDGTLRAPDFATNLLPAGFSVFKDNFQLTTQANVLMPVAHLDLPAGSYVIVAKLYAGVPVAQQGFLETVRCDLVAGTDFDRAFYDHDARTAFGVLSLNVVHQFASAGSVSLNCGHAFVNGSTTLNFIKITAIRVASLSNAPSP